MNNLLVKKSLELNSALFITETISSRRVLLLRPAETSLPWPQPPSLHRCVHTPPWSAQSKKNSPRLPVRGCALIAAWGSWGVSISSWCSSHDVVLIIINRWVNAFASIGEALLCRVQFSALASSLILLRRMIVALAETAGMVVRA